MAKYVLQELPEEMTDGKKIVFPKMQTYSLHDYETVIEHMRDYAGNISDGMIRAVFDALVSVMKVGCRWGTTSRWTGWACSRCHSALMSLARRKRQN